MLTPIFRNSISEKRFNKKRAILMGGAATLAVAIATPVYAQAEDEDSTDASENVRDEVVVRGIRRSLESAQDIKKNADTFVDAITAEDIGALSDRSIAEALQRVPGVAVTSFDGADDPDHFSVEGSGVVIRGLSFTRSELNGRDIFSSGLGRSLDFQDVPPELVSAVEVYKNLSADQVEGGIAGTVNLVTRKPLDKKGFTVAGSLEGNHSDRADGFTPTGSLLLSNTWETDAGEFGVLFSGSYSQLFNRSNGTQISVATNDVQGGFSSQINDIANANGGALPNTLPGGQFGIIGAGIRSEDRERERLGFDFAAQWRSPDQRTTATFEFFRTDTSLSWAENVIEASPDSISNSGGQQEGGTVVPVGGTILNVDENGQFLSGVLTSASAGWRGTATQAPGSCPNFGCGPESVFGRFAVGTPYLSTNRGRDEEAVVNNYSFNIQHEATERLRFSLDAQYLRADSEVFDAGNAARFYANTFLDFTNGQIPDVTFLPTENVQLGVAGVLPDADGNLTAAQQSSVDDFFSNGDNYFFRSIIDHIEDHDTDEFAIAGDAEYDIDSDWLESVKFGVRYSDRNQTARFTTFNWGVINEIWAGDEPNSLTDVANLANSLGIENSVEGFDFTGFQRGNVANPGTFLFAGDFFRTNGSAPGSQLGAIVDQLQLAFPSGAGNFFNPLAERNPADDGVTDLISGSPFRSSEITDISESTLAGYLLFKYNTGPLSGNFGVRYVRTNVSTTGFQTNQFLAPSTAAPGEPALCSTAGPDGVVGTADDLPPNQSAICTQLSPAEQLQVLNFFNGEPTNTSSRNVRGYFLPSLNVRYELDETKILRFAASRAISRPNFSQFRNNPFVSNDEDPITGEFRVRADGGNPFLDPVEAVQLDASFEWYFAQAGSVTVSAFWKRLSNIIQQGEGLGAPITNNGETFTPTIIGPANSASGNVQGVELAYRQFYDFLPGPLQNLGFEGTYTFVDQSSIPNSGTQDNLGDDGFGVEPSSPAFLVTDLQGLSRHTINATGIYETDDFSFRLAYNWRSRFLLTERDVIFPNLPIFNEAQASLDASFFYNINPNVKVGIQAVNLLDRVIETTQQINADGDVAPRSFFANDRRFTAALRFNF